MASKRHIEIANEHLAGFKNYLQDAYVVLLFAMALRM
jgi:hypothetical protein